MGFWSNLFGGGEKASIPATPNWYEDPNYATLQNFLTNYSQDWMKGNIPDYWKAIGEPVDTNLMGNYITENTADIKNAALERSAALGTGRSGVGAADTMNAIGNLSASLRFQDYLRAMQGREDLLGFGGGLITNTRDTAAAGQTERNQFNQWKYGADLSGQQYLNQQKQNRWQNVLNTISGGLTGGLTGAVSGAAGRPSEGSSDIIKNILDSISGNKKQDTVQSEYGNIKSNFDLLNFLKTVGGIVL